jgi:hypothetical protein
MGIRLWIPGFHGTFSMRTARALAAGDGSLDGWLGRAF